MKKCWTFLPLTMGVVWIGFSVLTYLYWIDKSLYILFPQFSFFLVFIISVIITSKMYKLNNEKQAKDDELAQKITWEKEQFELYKQKRAFEKPYIEENQKFNRLLELAKELKNKENISKQDVEQLQSQIDALKTRKDLYIEISRTLSDKTNPNENTETHE